jgi:alkylation response protein AidB-like acyl-CoA dehydrogenase
MTAAVDATDRAALIDSVRRLLADRCAEADVRRIMASETGHDPALWRALANLGVVGLTIAEAHGGAGLGAIELELVMEEAGAALLPAPLLSTVMAAALLAEGDNERLTTIAAGEEIAAVACGGRYDWTGHGDVSLSGGRVTGTARFVSDAAIADTILVALDEGVFAVAASESRVAPLPTFDRTRQLADVAFDAPARQIADASAIAPSLDLGIVALAGEQAGGARRILEKTVAYAAERHQFGRAIGSFQAIKHMAADLLLESESAISAARDAARQLAEDSPTRDAALALAAFACADAFDRCATDAIQMHGGIAFTWDHPAHLYLRRARSGAQLFGGSTLWRDRYLTVLEEAA